MVLLAPMSEKFDMPGVIIVALLPLVILALLVACQSDGPLAETSAPTATANTVPQRGPAPVEAVDIFQVDTFPVVASVVARGHFPNECMTIDQISQDRRGGTIFVAIDSVHSGDSACPEKRVAFEEAVELDLVGLPAGIYVVDVNGLQGTFKLQRDNIPDQGNAVVGGQIWQDRCDVIAAEEDGEVELAAGCMEFGDGVYSGNGLRESDETGLAGAIVHLGAGACPSEGLATTITDDQGEFLFSGLMSGTYCLSVASEEGQDDSWLSEGIWTFLSGGDGQIEVVLQPGDSRLDLVFGWSELRRPEQTVFLVQPDDECTNKALFVSDVSIPDDTRLVAGEVFTKTWRLQNLGSCTWDATYSLVLTAGDNMGVADSVPLTVTVPPGEFGELSVRLVAPQSLGVYRAEWKLLGPDGFLFGIGPGSNRPFWVQIVVVDQQAAD